MNKLYALAGSVVRTLFGCTKILSLSVYVKLEFPRSSPSFNDSVFTCAQGLHHRVAVSDKWGWESDGGVVAVFFVRWRAVSGSETSAECTAQRSKMCSRSVWNEKRAPRRWRRRRRRENGLRASIGEFGCCMDEGEGKNEASASRPLHSFTV